MTVPKLTGTRFVVSKKFDLNEYLRDSFSLFKGREGARLLPNSLAPDDDDTAKPPDDVTEDRSTACHWSDFGFCPLFLYCVFGLCLKRILPRQPGPPV